MDAEWLTYREAANHFGSSIEAVRRHWHINRFYSNMLSTCRYRSCASTSNGSKGATSLSARLARLPGRAESAMRWIVNRREVEREVDVRTSLLDLVREHLHLFGAKKGCNQGARGACIVLVDGERINSCLALAVQYQGREITTIEGLGAPGRAPSFAVGVRRTRRIPVRLLHARSDLLGGRHGGRASSGSTIAQFPHPAHRTGRAVSRIQLSDKISRPLSRATPSAASEHHLELTNCGRRKPRECRAILWLRKSRRFARTSVERNRIESRTTPRCAVEFGLLKHSLWETELRAQRLLREFGGSAPELRGNLVQRPVRAYNPLKLRGDSVQMA
jgi:hypothetical protein